MNDECDLKTEDIIQIASNAFGITIIFYNGNGWMKYRPTFTVFPEPPKIHLMLFKNNECVLLDKCKREKNCYETLKTFDEEIGKAIADIQKGENELNTLDKIKKEKKEELSKMKTEFNNNESYKKDSKDFGGKIIKLLPSINTMLEKFYIKR